MNIRNCIRTLCFVVLCFVFTNLSGQNPSHPVVDAHCHIKTSPDERIFQTMEEYFADNESVNIKYLFGITMARKGDIERMKAKNDSLFSMSKREARFIPVCSVHPSDIEAAIEELHRIKGLGGKIIKLHPITQNFSILGDETLRVVRTAGELGLVILIDGMGNAGYLDQLLELAIYCGNTKIIIAHMGGTDFHKLAGFNLIKTSNSDWFRNLWFDISTTVYLYADSPYKSQLEWIIRTVGVDRVLFGSDQPTVSLSNALKAFDKLDFNGSERERILYKNAIALLDLK